MLNLIRSIPPLHLLQTALVITGTLLRLVAGVWDNPIHNLFSDPARHWQNAERFLKPGLMGGFDPVFYQFVLFLVRKLTGDHPLGIGLYTGLLSACMPWLYYRAARSLGMGRMPARWYWALMTWLPSFFEIYRYFMMETLILPLMGLALWMTGRTCRKRDATSFLVMTAVWTLAGLTKTHAVPLAAICWAYALWGNPRWAKSAILSGAMIAVLLLPNAVRSYQILGYPAPLGSDYIVRIQQRSDATHIRILLHRGGMQYSSPSCYVEPLDPLNHWRIGRGMKNTIHEIRVDERAGRRDWESALEAVPRSFGLWCRQLAENIILFLFAPSWPDSNTERFGGWLNYHSRWIWAPLIFQLVIGNASVFVARKFPLIPVATVMMLLLLMFQNTVTMEGRYRKPLEPLLLLNFAWLWTPSAVVSKNNKLRTLTSSGENFRDRLLARVGAAIKHVRKGSVAGEVVRQHGEAEAERQICRGLRWLGMSEKKEGFGELKCGDVGKVLLAKWLKQTHHGGERLDSREAGNGGMKEDWHS